MNNRVFISYTSNDANFATQVRERVENNGMQGYLDKVDDVLLKDGPGLAEHLLKVMSECSHLIAVVGRETKASWWVPWEIGVGSERRMLMATFLNSSIELPTYLSKWPRLRYIFDVDTFCQNAKSTTQRMQTITEDKWQPESRRKSNIDNEFYAFHRNLKRSLT